MITLFFYLENALPPTATDKIMRRIAFNKMNEGSAKLWMTLLTFHVWFSVRIFQHVVVQIVLHYPNFSCLKCQQFQEKTFATIDYFPYSNRQQLDRPRIPREAKKISTKNKITHCLRK